MLTLTQLPTRHLIRSTQPAAVLLLVLLSHLALMAIPLHAEAMGPAMEASTTVVGAVDTAPRSTETCLASYADCMRAWISPSRVSIDTLVSLVLPGRLLPLLGEMPSLGLTPHVLGPPQFTDPQALLQVFRL